MTLSALIKKGGLTGIMTVTPATTATHQSVNPATVAPVATVAVTEQPKPLPELSSDEESIIRAWLAHIEETDPTIIAEVLDKCRSDLEARRFFLKRSKEVQLPTTDNCLIRCSDCAHFERIEHPHLGHCAKGEPESIAGLWDIDKRCCGRHLPKPKHLTPIIHGSQEPKE